MKDINPNDFPFADLLGIKKKETPEEEFRRKMRELAKKFPPITPTER